MTPKRILIYGVTGSGKSTLAQEVSTRTGLPYVSIDDLAWLPGWHLVPEEVQREQFMEACDAEEWVIDSAYSHCLDIALDRADLIVGLDYPRWLSFGRLLKRTVLRVVSGEPVCNGNRESLRMALSRDSILRWHFRSFSHKRRRMRQWVKEGRCILLHRNPSETRNWLDQIGSEINCPNPKNPC